MTGIPWRDKDIEDLLTAWKERVPDINTFEFSKQYSQMTNGKRSVNSVNSKLKYLGVLHVPASTRHAWNTPPIVKGNSLVIGDTQIPFHHGEFISKCIDVAVKWKIDNLILGGDAMDWNALSSFAPDFSEDDKQIVDNGTKDRLIKFAETLKAKDREKLYDLIAGAEAENGNLSDEIKESRRVLKSLEEKFEKILWMMGNHEKRLIKILNRVLDTATLSRLMGTDTPKWTVSPYYWCILESAGVKWQIEHPLNTGKGTSKKLADKFDTNIIMFHNHHYSVTSSPNGKYQAIEPGMAADEDRMAYASQRHNTADTHMKGAVIVREGKATVLNKFTDWDIL